MNGLVIDALAYLAALGGFTAFFLAMPRHQQDWLGNKLSLSAGRSVRLLGIGFFAAGAALNCAGHGWSHGLVLAFGFGPASAAVVIAAHCNRARALNFWRERQ